MFVNFVTSKPNCSHMIHTCLLSMSLLVVVMVSNGQQASLKPETAQEISSQAQLPYSFDQPDIRFVSIPENEIAEQLNNKPLYKASTKKGKLNGAWQSWYQNGMPCDSGTLVSGLPDGVWKHWDSEGNLLSVRTYHADKFERINHEIRRYHPRKVTFPLVHLYKKNETWARQFLHASYSFKKTPWRTDDHSINNLVTSNITAGNKYRPVFDHSLHHGLYKNLFANGAVKDSGYYKDGLKEGPWMHRAVNGWVSQGVYAHGTKVREWKTYDSAGKLQEIDFYTSSGKLKWTKRFK